MTAINNGSVAQALGIALRNATTSTTFSLNAFLPLTDNRPIADNATAAERLNHTLAVVQIQLLLPVVVSRALFASGLQQLDSDYLLYPTTQKIVATNPSLYDPRDPIVRVQTVSYPAAQFSSFHTVQVGQEQFIFQVSMAGLRNSNGWSVVAVHSFGKLC